MNECAVVELTDGTLMLNSRSYRGKACRGVSLSNDGGETWEPTTDDPALVESVCQASLIRYSWPTAEAQRGLLCSATPPSPAAATTSPSAPATTTAKPGPIRGSSAKAPPPIPRSPRSPSGEIGLLYERDDYKHLTFARFPLDWITSTRNEPLGVTSNYLTQRRRDTEHRDRRMKSANRCDRFLSAFLCASAPLRLCVNSTALALLSTVPFQPACADEPNRSPVDLVLGPNDAWLVTVNQTSDTVSLVRTSDGHVLDEAAVGHHPVGIALAPDGKTLLVSGHYSGEVTLLEVSGDKLRKARRRSTSAISRTASPSRRTERRPTSPARPTPSRRARPGRAKSHRPNRRRPLAAAPGPLARRLAPGRRHQRRPRRDDRRYAASKRPSIRSNSSASTSATCKSRKDGQYVWFPWMVYRNNPITPGNIRLGWVLASRIARVRLDGPARREAMSLDPQGKAIADVDGLALTSDESRLVVSASGTHELLVYRTDGLPLKDYGGTDHIDPELLKDDDRFYRIELGGRPMGLRIGQRRPARSMSPTISTTACRSSIWPTEKSSARSRSAAQPSRRWPAAAKRSSTTPAAASTSGTVATPATTKAAPTASPPTRTTTARPSPSRPCCRSIISHETGPWTWHGWQTDLQAAMKKSLTETMLGPQPTDDDADGPAGLPAIARSAAQSVPRQGRLAIRRRRSAASIVFESDKAACATCHSGPHFTDGQIHDVGLGSPRDRYKGFNTPIAPRRLSTGQAAPRRPRRFARSRPHRPARSRKSRRHAASSATEELSDLVEYLKSL